MALKIFSFQIFGQIWSILSWKCNKIKIEHHLWFDIKFKTDHFYVKQLKTLAYTTIQISLISVVPRWTANYRDLSW